MLKELNSKEFLLKGGYIKEIKVWDSNTRKTYYVVVRLGDLLYATFKSSYIDYLLGKTDKPEMVEGDVCMWFDLETDRGETRFHKFYQKAFVDVTSLEHKLRLSRKYARLKKPLGNFVYKVESRNRRLVHGCGPSSDIYEIKIHLLDSDTYLYIYADDYAYCIAKESVFKTLDEDKVIDWIEEIDSFSKAKRSQYYDLYLEMERYKDNFYEK